MMEFNHILQEMLDAGLLKNRDEINKDENDKFLERSSAFNSSWFITKNEVYDRIEKLLIISSKLKCKEFDEEKIIRTLYDYRKDVFYSYEVALSRKTISYDEFKELVMSYLDYQFVIILKGLGYDGSQKFSPLWGIDINECFKADK
jgi:hypothetical protein